MNTPQHQNTRNEESIETNLVSPPDDRNTFIKERKDVLMGMYCDNRAHARHYEDKKATVSNIIMLATVGLIGYIHHLDYEDWPLTGAIALVGVFGAAFTKFYFECISSYERRADELRNGLNALLFESSADSASTLIDILARTDGIDPHELANAHKPKMAWFRKVWPLGITLFALVATIYALTLTPKSQNTNNNKETTGAASNSQPEKP